jgi:molybdopterin converting factor small subunit
MLVYPTFFSPYQYKAEKRLEELKQNPEFQKDVEKLLSNYNEKSIYLRFKTQNTEFISKLILKKEPIILGGEDFSHLTLKDLEREEIKDQLARAAIREAYGLGTEKNMISTGTVGTDRFLSGGLLQLSFIPLMLLRNNGSYQIMCLGNKTPIRTFIISSLWTVGFNSLLQEVYYLFRKYTINQ